MYAILTTLFSHSTTLLFIIVSGIFAVLNARIVLTDIRERRIPNRLVMGVALCGVILLVLQKIEQEVVWQYAWGAWFLWTAAALPLSFFVWKMGIWAPGDAKYVAALAIAVPGGILSLGGNIALVSTMWVIPSSVYILLKSLASRKKFTNAWGHFKSDFRGRISALTHTTPDQPINKQRILLFIAGAFALALFFRVARRWLMGEVSLFTGLREWTLHKPALSLLVTLGIGFLLIYIVQYVALHAQKIIQKWVPFLRPGAGSWAALGLFMTLIGVEIFWYGFSALWEILALIITFPGIFLVWRAAKYLVMIASQIDGLQEIPYQNLTAGDLVDKTALIKILGTQKCLGYQEHSGCFSPSPSAVIEKFPDPLDEESVTKLITALETVNQHQSRENPQFTPLKTIKVLKPFAFAPYLLVAFLLTVLFGDQLVGLIMTTLLGSKN